MNVFSKGSDRGNEIDFADCSDDDLMKVDGNVGLFHVSSCEISRSLMMSQMMQMKYRKVRNDVDGVDVVDDVDATLVIQMLRRMNVVGLLLYKNVAVENDLSCNHDENETPCALVTSLPADVYCCLSVGLSHRRTVEL